MNRTTTGPPASPEQALLTIRVIGFSLGLGVTLFAAVTTYLHWTRGNPGPAEAADLMFDVMVIFALVAVLTSIAVWRLRVAPLLERPRADADWRQRAAAIHTGAILSWGLIEGAALFAEVVYFLHGSVLAGALGVVLIWGALALTWPKPEWLLPGRG